MAYKLLSFLAILLFIVINPSHCCYKAIFSFGDSLTDTGNDAYASAGKSLVSNFPYGITYFHKPTGRYSDGRLILDFIASAFGLPLVPPYLPYAGASDVQEVFRYGANFAVGGVTALDNEYFEEKGMRVYWHDYSLSVQIKEFKQLLPLLSSDSSDLLSKSLIILGEIGGNDYIHSVEQNKPIDETKAMFPDVISAISRAIDTIIELGAKVIVVPGVFPFGCTPFFVNKYASNRSEDYDIQSGCMKWLNELSSYHNELLQDELDAARNRYPHTTIIYADYYNAFLSICENPKKFGFNETIKACCGGKGRYGTEYFVMCGTKDAPVCSDPSVYVSWDGLHSTEAVYNVIARGLFDGPYATPALGQTCSLISSY